MMGYKELLGTCVMTLTVLSMPTFAKAQDGQGNVNEFGPAKGDWEMTLGGSGSSDKDFDAGGFGMSGSLGYFFTEHWELALRQGYSFFDGEDDTWSGSTRAAVDFHFDLNRLQPFVGATFGGLYGKGVNDSWAAGIEGGLKYYVKPKTFIFGMAEYQWLFKDADSVDNNFDEGQLLYSLGIGFNF